MQIINATTRIKSIMADNGQSIQLMPGKVSEVFLASKQLILAAIKLGTPKEIGIVTGGSYEFEIAKSITAAAPYLYNDLNEAKAKLIDPSIDYSAKRAATADMLVKQQLIDRTAELNKANEELAKLKKQLESESNNELISKLNNIIAEKTTQSDTLSKRITELENQLKKANENEQALRLEVSELNSKYSTATSTLEALRKDFADEVAKKEEYKNELDSLPSTESIGKLQNSLIEAQEALELKKKEVKQLEEEIKSFPDKASILANQDKITDLEAKLAEAQVNLDQAKMDAAAKDEKLEQLKTALGETLKANEDMKNSFNEACAKFNITKDAEGEWIQLS